MAFFEVIEHLFELLDYGNNLDWNRFKVGIEALKLGID